MNRRQKTIAVLALALLPPAAGAGPLENAIEAFVMTETQGLPGQVRITVGGLDQRSKLGPCTAFEPFLAAKARLWGQSTVGVRCRGPSTWTAYIPVQVQVFGRYLRSTRNLSAGQPLAAGDIEVVDADLTTLPTGVLTDPAQAIGKPIRMSLAARQALRADQVVSPPSVRQGQVVKLISRGPGFVVSSEGKALNNAAEGQPVQVRAASGETLSGIARPGGVVEIGY